MAIYADMHVHTTFSSDGKGSMDEMIQKALSLGLRHICFTEHNDFDYPRHEGDLSFKCGFLFVRTFDKT